MLLLETGLSGLCDDPLAKSMCLLQKKVVVLTLWLTCLLDKRLGHNQVRTDRS